MSQFHVEKLFVDGLLNKSPNSTSGCKPKFENHKFGLWFFFFLLENFHTFSLFLAPSFQMLWNKNLFLTLNSENHQLHPYPVKCVRGVFLTLKKWQTSLATIICHYLKAWLPEKVWCYLPRDKQMENESSSCGRLNASKWSIPSKKIILTQLDKLIIKYIRKTE